MNQPFAAYAPTVQHLIDAAPDLCLGPGSPNEQAKRELRALSPDALSEKPVIDREMAQCCISGLWLLHDFLDDSHTISQDISSQEGSYWHAIMHRREPDYSNAKYWFRRVGNHPIFDALAREARQLAAESSSESKSLAFLSETEAWDPYAFVDFCERADASNERLANEIAGAEWRLLFDYCFRSAHGE